VLLVSSFHFLLSQWHRFCTRCLVGGRYTPFLMQKKRNTDRIHERLQNDNENDNFWHRKWSVWDTAFSFLFLSLSSPFSFSCLFLYSSFSFSFPFSCPFSFPFSFPFPFLFLSLSYSFLSLSFSSPFPILSFPFLYYSFSFSLFSLMWNLWSRCEASAWKNDKRKKKTITSGKTIGKGSGFLQTPIWKQMCGECRRIWAYNDVYMYRLDVRCKMYRSSWWTSGSRHTCAQELKKFGFSGPMLR